MLKLAADVAACRCFVGTAAYCPHGRISQYGGRLDSVPGRLAEQR